MSTARDLAIKWVSYTIVILLLLFGHSFFLGQYKIWGVLPFLPPVILALVASLEDSDEAVLFGLCFGICCDLTLTVPLPCLYTLAFTASALLGSLLTKTALQRGFFCSLIVTILTFGIIYFFTAPIMFWGGHTSLSAFLFLCLRELLVSLLLLPFCYPVFSFLHRFFLV